MINELIQPKKNSKMVNTQKFKRFGITYDEY
jgi:hypothetical protein